MYRGRCGVQSLIVRVIQAASAPMLSHTYSGKISKRSRDTELTVGVTNFPDFPTTVLRIHDMKMRYSVTLPRPLVRSASDASMSGRLHKRLLTTILWDVGWFQNGFYFLVFIRRLR